MATAGPTWRCFDPSRARGTCSGRAPTSPPTAAIYGESLQIFQCRARRLWTEISDHKSVGIVRVMSRVLHRTVHAPDGFPRSIRFLSGNFQVAQLTRRLGCPVGLQPDVDAAPDECRGALDQDFVGPHVDPHAAALHEPREVSTPFGEGLYGAPEIDIDVRIAVEVHEPVHISHSERFTEGDGHRSKLTDVQLAEERCHLAPMVVIVARHEPD